MVNGTKIRKRDTLFGLIMLVVMVSLPFIVYTIGKDSREEGTKELNIAEAKAYRIEEGTNFKVYNEKKEILLEGTPLIYKGYDSEVYTTRYNTWEKEKHYYYNEETELYLEDSGGFAKKYDLKVGDSITTDIIATSYTSSQYYDFDTRKMAYLNNGGLAHEVKMNTIDKAKSKATTKEEGIKSISTGGFKVLNEYTSNELKNTKYKVVYNVLTKDNETKDSIIDVEIYIEDLESTISVRADLQELVSEAFQTGAEGKTTLIETKNYEGKVKGILEIGGKWYYYTR